MPIYEYLCQNCGRRFEQLQRMVDDPLTECIHCEGAVRRVIQPVGIIFKGSGFYATDSRKSASASSNGSSESSSSDGAAKPEAKSEAKAETKSEGSADSSAAAAKPAESKPAPAAAAKTS